MENTKVFLVRGVIYLQMYIKTFEFTNVHTHIYIYTYTYTTADLPSGQKTKQQDTARFEHKILQNKQPHEIKSQQSSKFTTKRSSYTKISKTNKTSVQFSKTKKNT